MSIFGVFITYACSWWLVLFMVLPWKVKIAENPVVGHAPSAPVNPMIRKKMLITTILAILPTVMMYVIVGQAAHGAEPDMYHAGSSDPDCGDGVNYHPPADLAAKDDVTMKDPNNITSDVRVGVATPMRDFNHSGNDQMLRDSDLYMGDVVVKPNGETSFNGKPLGQQNLDTKGCK